jgi:endonuclease/exonuclease/phosphatase family metal-dependent hydrolase
MCRHTTAVITSGLLLSVALSASATSSTPQVTIRIATFNAEFLTRPRVHIKFGLPFNIAEATAAEQAQWAAAGFRDTRFTEAAQHVAQVIAGINADVVALSEVGNDTDVAELNAEIADLGVNYPHVEVCDCTDNTTQQHVAVLSRFPLTNVIDRLPGRAIYDEELDDPEREEDTGISKGMRISFQADGQTFHLYVLHLASERGGNEQDQQRIAQASIVRRHYLPDLNNGGHIIVVGDLNDHPGQPALRRIRGRDDIWGDLIQTGNVEFFAAGTEDTRWTFEFQGKRQQIDHILVSRSIVDAANDIVTSTVDHGDPLASDHRPLVVILDL